MNVVLVAIILGGFIVSLFIIRYWIASSQKKNNISEELILWLKDMTTRMDSQTKQMDLRLGQNIDVFNKRLDKAAEAMMHVQRSIGEFSEIGRSMKDLQQLLQSPKLRGNIGEHILKELLAQCLPKDFFTLQYGFKNGEKVDAVIKTSQGLVPIDSKFPLSKFKEMIENEKLEEKKILQKEFIRDVMVHIKSISGKYILPSEGTVDYALMYIPSESVYYEIINLAELFDYASEKHVVPVSPMSFYAYLKVILLSFEGQRIEKQAENIIKILLSMKKDYEKADESMSILHKHIANAYNQSSQVSQNLMKIGQKIESTTDLSLPKVEEKMLE